MWVDHETSGAIVAADWIKPRTRIKPGTKIKPVTMITPSTRIKSGLGLNKGAEGDTHRPLHAASPDPSPYGVKSLGWVAYVH